MAEASAVGAGDVLGGRYCLLEEIGRGGFGAVFRAQDRRLDRPVAVKMLLPFEVGRGHAEELLERFRREAWIMARLKHPHIATVYDRDVHEGVVFLVMDLLSGPGLDQMQRERGPLPVDEVLGYGVQVADALAHIHGRTPTVVHRDLKPSNLVLDDGVLKVCDFGIAAVLAPELTAYTRTGGPPGTPVYMSPEHWRGEEALPGWDVFSFGVVLYSLLAGGSPFWSPDGPQAIGRLVQYEHPEPIADRRVGVPPALAVLIETMLAKSPEGRPTAVEAGAELRAVVAGRSVAAEAAEATADVTDTTGAADSVTSRFGAEFERVRAEYGNGRELPAALRLARLRVHAAAALGAEHELVRMIERYWEQQS